MRSSRRSSSESLNRLCELINSPVVRFLLTTTLFCFAVLAIEFATGCSRAVLIPESSPIRIGPQTQGMIYTLIKGEWVLMDNTVTIPEGWYAVPPSFVEESKEVSPS